MKEIISIIIPTFNRAHLILDTLVSIQKQTYPYWECIIVDDGSVDNSKSLILDFLKDDRRFIYLQRPENRPKGASSCRNYGFEISKGEYIQFFDSDDIMNHDHLKEKVENILGFDFVVCKIKSFEVKFDENDFLLDKIENINYEENVFESFVIGRFPMVMVAPMWRKKVLEKNMPIREDLSILEDHELYSRILFNHNNYCIINKVLIYVRMNLPSLTNSFYKNINEGLDSYLEAKITVLKLSNTNTVKLAILKMTLGFFRMGLAQKEYKNAEKCLKFIKNKKLCYSYKLKLDLCRIIIFYHLFRIIGRGDTKFKFLLKV